MRLAFLLALAALLALGTASCAYVAEAPDLSEEPASELAWTVGRVVVRQGGGRSVFKSSGFAFPYRGEAYFITTLHTLEDIRRNFGPNTPVMVELPGMGSGLKRARHVFSVKREDSAVFVLDDALLAAGPEIQYRNPCPAPRGKDLLIIGYSGINVGGYRPDFLRTGILACGTKRGKWLYLGVRHSSTREMPVVLVGEPIVRQGMSGSPVFHSGTRTLAGMVKGHTENRLDPESAAMLGASEFSVIVPLNRTMKRIRKLRQQ